MIAIPKELAHLRDADLARILGTSRQRIWQLRRAEKNLCTICSLPAEVGYIHKLCVKCRESVNRGQRKRFGFKAWRSGKRGRVPIWAKELL